MTACVVPKILLLTAENLPHDDYETALVGAALHDLGVESEIVAWTSPALPQADLAVIRTTWDYTKRLGEFLEFLQGLEAQVSNPLDVVRWNCHKGYLAVLAGAGVPVVPTQVLRAADVVAPDSSGPGLVVPDFGSPEIIIKPAVSAGARGIGRFTAGSSAAALHLADTLKSNDALVQPFQPDVADGERSLIHLGGVFSHAVLKLPTAGEFRVQEQFGGTNVPHTPSAAELAVADAALAVVPGGAESLSYARVDLVGPPAHPVVMELELIEPELFLHRAPGSAGRFARVLAALV